MRLRARSETRTDVAKLVVRYGGPVASGLLDPSFDLFGVPGVDGAIGYRSAWGCAVVVGDPVCAPEDRVPLAEAFRAFCRSNGWRTVYCAAGPELADEAVARGCTAIEFGQELIVDPRRDPQAGSQGRELRKKVAHARRDGATVREYEPCKAGRDARLEQAMEDVVAGWLRARHGLQLFMSYVQLFDARDARRWFYACANGRVVGVLAMLRMDARDGYLLQHLLAAPGAPIGTTELLCATGLATLGAEGARSRRLDPHRPRRSARCTISGGSRRRSYARPSS